MKRGSPGDTIPSLESLLLHQIVSSFETEESFRFYLGSVKRPEICALLEKTWEQKKTGISLVVHKKRFLSAEVVVSYLDIKELSDNSGIVTQHEKKHIIPLNMETTTGNQFLDHVQSRLLVKGLLSPHHRSIRFNVY